MNNISKLNKSINTILVVLLSIFCFPLIGEAETITVQNGFSHSVTGYATDLAAVYAADIYWHDMVFVFDRGKYDYDSGKLVRASDVKGPEKGRNKGDINCWYGFDGDINRIIVLNRSNRNLAATYASEIYSNVYDDDKVVSTLYDYDDNNSDGGYVIEIEQDINNENYGYPKNFYSDDIDPFGDDSVNRFGNGKSLESKTKTIRASQADGKMYANKVFLNITGTPSDTFQKYELDENNEPISAKMGCITITLSKTTN